MNSYRRTLRHLWLVLALAPIPAYAGSALIYVTNSAGDSIHAIDAATNKVVQEIKGVEGAHGIGFAPDGSRIYVSDEAYSTLDVFDRKSGRLAKQVLLSGHPNNIAVAKDGRVVVGIARGAGALDIIDPTTLARVKSVPVNGPLHNVYVTPDSKHVVTGSIRTGIITFIDLATEQPVWELKLDKGIRPMTIEAAPDGSPKRIFVQLTAFNGFAVVDFAARKEVARIELHRDAMAGLVAAFHLPFAVVELDLANEDHAVHDGDVAGLVDRHQRRTDADRLGHGAERRRDAA